MFARSTAGATLWAAGKSWLMPWVHEVRAFAADIRGADRQVVSKLVLDGQAPLQLLLHAPVGEDHRSTEAVELLRTEIRRVLEVLREPLIPLCSAVADLPCVWFPRYPTRDDL
jgi:hypothetical protein